MTWTTSIALAVLCLSSHMIAVKFLGEKFPAPLVTASFYTFALVTLYLVYAVMRPEVEWQSFLTTKTFVLLAIAGVTIGLTDFFFVQSIGQGASVSVALPLLLAGSATAVAIIALLFLGELASAYKIMGIALCIAGIVLINKG